jgi:hypothetical protein
LTQRDFFDSIGLITALTTGDMKMKTMTLALVLLLLQGVSMASASPSIKILNADRRIPPLSDTLLQDQIQKNFNTEQYREVRIQIVYDQNQKPDHLVLIQLVKGLHKVIYARAELNPHFVITGKTENYRLADDDFAELRKKDPKPACPDTSVQFIAFAPNDEDVEQQVTEQVAQAAEAAKLKTIRLLKAQATRKNYLDYMSCPNVKGNFYDGDADPSTIVTVDGVIASTDFSSLLQGAFRFKVTNIWLACEAYNDPMLASVVKDAQAQKYAAGINDLHIGPSDQAAACAMEASIQGQPMTQAFQDCYKKLDVTDDHWGFGGDGSDLFGN